MCINSKCTYVTYGVGLYVHMIDQLNTLQIPVVYHCYPSAMPKCKL